MKPLIAASLLLALGGCLNQPPTPRTVDINTMPQRQADQVVNNVESGATPWVTVTGRLDLREVFSR